MSFETISGTNIQYGLISFDAGGKEMSEQGGLMGQHLIDKARTDKITNVFFFCHGWKGDAPSAKEQYSLWIKAFANSRDKARRRKITFRTFDHFSSDFIGLVCRLATEEVGEATAKPVPVASWIRMRYSKIS